MSYWYGLSYSEIARMPISAINAYLDKLNVRKTETKLIMADAASIPHMKPQKRKIILGNWTRIVDMHSPQKAKPATDARLKMMGIGVRHV